MTQKELMEMYMRVIREYWSNPRMQEYERKECSYIVDLSNGKIISIDKPRILKDFCFGYGMYGVCTEEEIERASKLAAIAMTDEKYFISKNMEEINNKIESLKTAYKVYVYPKYYMQKDDILVTYYCARSEWDLDMVPDKTKLTEIRKEDIQKIIDGLEIVKQKFEKRLKTYLKRYGLSKLNVWTYLID